MTNFLFKSYGVRIELIALDFIKDAHDKIYFLDCHGFKLQDYEKLSRIALLSEEQAFLYKQESKYIYDKANNTV